MKDFIVDDDDNNEDEDGVEIDGNFETRSDQMESFDDSNDEVRNSYSP